MVETHEHRVKRLYMRSIRRGIKEMDLILTRFADLQLRDLDADALDAYEALLEESDHDLYAWVSGQQTAPNEHAAMIQTISLAVKDQLKI